MLMYIIKRCADKISKKCILVKMFKDLKEICVCPLGSGFGNLIELVQLIGLWSLIDKYHIQETSVVTTELGLFVQM